jgi:hypothetical protein
MTVVLYVLAFIGAWFLLAVVAGLIFGLFRREPDPVDLDPADVDLRDRMEPYTNVRVLRDQDAS